MTTSMVGYASFVPNYTNSPYIGDFNGNALADFTAATPLKFGGVEIYQGVKTIEKIMPYGDIDLDGKIDPFNYQNGYLHVDYSGDALGYIQTNIAIAAKASDTAQLEIFVHSMDASAPYAATGEILHSFDSEVVGGERVLKENATFAGDFDGNGLPDLVITQMNGPLLKAMPMGQSRSIKHNHSTPDTLSFVDSPAPASPVYDGNGQFSFFSYFIDINGDGLTDVLGWKDQLLSIRINLGNGTMSTTSVTKGLTQLHSHTYSEYDEYLNIKAEVNNLTGLNKTYNYDNLNRLTTYTASNTSPAFSLSVNYAHDAVGNLLKKTDYSANKDTAYQYCTGSNALCILEKASGQTVNFTYDGRGNLINGDGLTLTYNPLNKPLSKNINCFTPCVIDSVARQHW